MKTVLKQVSLFALYGTLGGVITLIAVAAVYLESREDLQIWHTAELDGEYHAGLELATFTEYLELESRLFDELDLEVISRIAGGPDQLLNRFASGSLSSPEQWETNWNRSFEFPVASPKAGILMLHGMSDSPYSLRALAERLHADGVHVVGLRYPGHGTAPASLTRTAWEDLAGAVHLAARHLQGKLGDAPMYVLGYSTGAPLAVELTLSAQADNDLTTPAGLVFLSPAMGLTPLAALAPWQAYLGRLLGLEKFDWNTLEPEYDPFKYRSFPLNAAIQVWRLASHVRSLIDQAAQSDELENLPPILTFQSVVDSTIAVEALAEVLYNKLPRGGHRVVAYDLNRIAGMDALIARDPGPVLDRLLADDSLRFEFALVTNRGDGENVVMREGKSSGRGDCPLVARWPKGVYSLSHIALPFPPDDLLYGGPGAPSYPGVQLGDVALRGESGALRISPGGLLRQSWNPFFESQYRELAYFIGIGSRPCLPD